MHRDSLSGSSASRASGATGSPGGDAAVIETSHQRSAGYGLCPGARPDFMPLARSDLSLLVEQNHLLHAHAVPAMETLYQQIIDTHTMVLLTDAHGVILHSLGDADFIEKANRVALAPGVGWSEERMGTNAIGTAIAERAPSLVHADQHYLAANHFLTCSASQSPTTRARSSACSTSARTGAAITSTPWPWCACPR